MINDVSTVAMLAGGVGGLGKAAVAIVKNVKKTVTKGTSILKNFMKDNRGGINVPKGSSKSKQMKMNLQFFAEKGGKGIKNVSKPYIQNGTYNEIRNKLGKDATDKFIDAMNKGLVSGTGESGIKLLGGQGAKVGNTYYKYEIKIKGSFGDYRVYGNYSDKLGTIVFDKFSRGVGH